LKAHGFTLIEMLTVVVIVTIIAGIVLGMAGISRRQAMENKAKSQIGILGNLLDDYMLEHGSFPAVLEIPEILGKLPESFTVVTGPSRVLDPWDEPYQYSRDSAYSCSLFSKGTDKTSHTGDDIR
jgi:general secretion pathway protein G